MANWSASSVWNRPLHVVPCGLCRWLYDHLMLWSQLGEPLSLASVAAYYQRATSMRREGAQCDGHSPPLHCPKTTAITGNEHDH